MAYLGKATTDEVVAACQAGAVELGAALAGLLGGAVEVAVEPLEHFDPDAASKDWAEPGLMVLLTVEGSAALLVLSESCGLLPDWYADPDATGQSVLATLAQEAGMLVLPEQFMPEGFKAARVSNLAEAIERGGVAAGAGVVPLRLKAPSGNSGVLSLIWPADSPGDVFADPPAAKGAPAATAPKEAISPAVPAAQASAKLGQFARSVEELPTYSRSLLRIKVPVIVTLAETKQPIGRIVELGPGTIIQFDKSCEEMLSLQVGDQPVAEGEAVKVGDKFGIRLTSLRLPGERFKPVRRR
ncbi:MAG TPA: FliM/FliN family flagellar motor C-terminal domain-containing protein [Pirellulales bacterium]|nr:FliM/FliN family flagellar motor C-terminal domain-containing protein [Pirellulales bacterium]